MRELDTLERLLQQARASSGDEAVRVVLEALSRPPNQQPRNLGGGGGGGGGLGGPGGRVPQFIRRRHPPEPGEGYGDLHERG